MDEAIFGKHIGVMCKERNEAIIVERDEVMGREELVELLCSNYEYVRKMVYRNLGYNEDSEDVTQNVMVNAFRKIEDLREPEKIKGWLNTIISNEFKALYAKNEKYVMLINKLKMEAGAADLADESEYVAAEIAFREMMRKAEEEDLVNEILDSLDPVNRSILNMKFRDGRKFSEISKIMDINANTVRSMYARCRDRLCKKYGEVGKGAGLNVK